MLKALKELGGCSLGPWLPRPVLARRVLVRPVLHVLRCSEVLELLGP